MREEVEDHRMVDFHAVPDRQSAQVREANQYFLQCLLAQLWRHLLHLFSFKFESTHNAYSP